MKSILVSVLMFCFCFVFGQTSSITCHKCDVRSRLNCNSCVIAGSTFSGFVVKRLNKADVALYAPVKVTNRNKWFQLSDLYGTKIDLDISTVATHNTIKKFYDFVSECSCTEAAAEIEAPSIAQLYRDIESDEEDLFFNTGTASKYYNFHDSLIIGEALTTVGDTSIKVNVAGNYKVTFTGTFNVSPIAFVYCAIYKNSTELIVGIDNVTHVTNDFGQFSLSYVVSASVDDVFSVRLYRTSSTSSLTPTSSNLIVEKIRTP